MKITDLKITPVFIPVEAPLRHAWGAHMGISRIIIQIFTDEGYVGLGECYPGSEFEALFERYRPQIVGEDPFNLERLRWKIASPATVKYFGNANHIYAAVEFACLDIIGQAVNRPVYDLLGGKVRDRIPFAAYLFYRYPNEEGNGEISTPEKMVEYATKLVNRYGFKSLKLKGGVLSPNVEIATFVALRKKFPDFKIRIDANGIWSISTSIYVANKLRDYDMEYFEDPTFGMRGMARINKKCPWVMLATNTCVFGFEDIPAAVAMEPVDVLLCDPHWYGGLNGVRNLARFCEVFNFDIGMHSGTEFGVSLAAMLHIAAAVSTLCQTHYPDAHYHHLTDDIIQGGKMEYKDGCIEVPKSPGLGIKLDEEKMQKYHQMYKLHPYKGYTLDERRKEFIPIQPRW